MAGERRRKPKRGNSGAGPRHGSGRDPQRGSKRGGASSRDASRSHSGKARGGAVPSEQVKRKLPAAAQGLPRHVVEALIRVTPKARQNAALSALAEAAEAFSGGQYHVAVRKAEHAKELSARDATIREVLGLAAYRIGDWQKALRELRTYRRLSGETTHMPIEMDTLRALDRPKDVTAVWEEFSKLGGGPAAKKEARVVYASHLIDVGELEEADSVAGSPRLVDDPWPEDLRLWYVAARIAGLSQDKVKARRLADAIVLSDPSFPGLDELDRLIETP